MNDVLNLIDKYRVEVQEKLLHLRRLISEVAGILSTDVPKTLKWGEPSYLVKGGSTVRFDWKASKPHEYAMYFNCKIRLMETFRQFYDQELVFEGRRTIILKLDEAVPEAVLKHCIQLALLTTVSNISLHWVYSDL